MTVRKRYSEKAIKLPQSARETAEAEGYTPMRFHARMMRELTAELESWGEDLRRGLKPEALAHLSVREARDLYVRCALDLVREEGKNADLYYPKMRATDASVSVDGTLNVNVIKFSDADDNGSE